MQSRRLESRLPVGRARSSGPAPAPTPVPEPGPGHAPGTEPGFELGSAPGFQPGRPPDRRGQPLTVVAIGGNALAEGAGGPAEAARRAAEDIAALAAAGVPLAITHGNGPQVGRALIRAAAAEPDLPPLPMDIAVAHTQGEIGLLLAVAIERAVAESRPVVALISRTLVAADDPAFDAPDKPIGPWMSEVQAQRLSRLRGWTVKPVGARGWRRVVASPEPRQILEAGVIGALVSDGAIVICGGGGGIPVVRDDSGLRGVEAVVDKDLASALLAEAIGAARLIIATDVPGVALDYGGPDERWLKRLDAGQARALLDGAHFPPGSMGPKVRAALRFVEGGAGRVAAITALDRIRAAFLDAHGDGEGDGLIGTLFTRDDASSPAGPGDTHSAGDRTAR